MNNGVHSLAPFSPAPDAFDDNAAAVNDLADEISTKIGSYLCRGYCMLATACDDCGTVMLRDRQGTELCVAQEIAGACAGGKQLPGGGGAAAAATAAGGRRGGAAVEADSDDEDDEDAAETAIMEQRARDIAQAHQNHQILQQRMEQLAAAEAERQMLESMYAEQQVRAPAAPAPAPVPAPAPALAAAYAPTPAPVRSAAAAPASRVGSDIRDASRLAGSVLAEELGRAARAMGGATSIAEKIELANMIAAVGGALKSIGDFV
jgi:uncharacterized Zn finger protein (UPF0148 family)